MPLSCRAARSALCCPRVGELTPPPAGETGRSRTEEHSQTLGPHRRLKTAVAHTSYNQGEEATRSIGQ